MAALAGVGLAAYVGLHPETMAAYPALGPEAPAGLFAGGFGFVALGFGLLVALGAGALPRLGRTVRSGGARLGVGAGCVVSAAVGLWALGVGTLIPVVLQPGAWGTFWALVFGAAGAVLFGSSVVGVCTAIRRRRGRPRTHHTP